MEWFSNLRNIVDRHNLCRYQRISARLQARLLQRERLRDKAQMLWRAYCRPHVQSARSDLEGAVVLLLPHSWLHLELVGNDRSRMHDSRDDIWHYWMVSWSWMLHQLDFRQWTSVSIRSIWSLKCTSCSGLQFIHWGWNALKWDWFARSMFWPSAGTGQKCGEADQINVWICLRRRGVYGGCQFRYRVWCQLIVW